MGIYPGDARHLRVGPIARFKRHPAHPDLWPRGVVQKICDRLHGATGPVWLLAHLVCLVASQSCPRAVGHDAAGAAVGPGS